MSLTGWRDARLAIHLALTIIVAGFGSVLALPTNTFGVSSSFNFMASLASENVWAVVLWIASTIGFVGMVTHSKAMRFISVLVLATAHGILGISFALAPQFGTGAITYTVIAGLGYYLAWRRTIEGV